MPLLSKQLQPNIRRCYLFSQLDKLPGQVSLQVVIAEVELSDNVKTGIDWFYDSTKNYEASGSGSWVRQADYFHSPASKVIGRWLYP